MKENENHILTKLKSIEEIYVGKSIMNLDILGISYVDEGTQHIVFGLEENTLGLREENRDYAKRVLMKEWLFGMLCSCLDIRNYEEQINNLFYKRLYTIDDDIIREHKEWDLYAQTSQCMNMVIKLSSIIQHDLSSNVVDSVYQILDYQGELMNGRLNLSMFSPNFKKDVVKLIKKMRDDAKKREGLSIGHMIQSMVMDEVYSLVKYKKVEINPNIYTSVFFCGISNLLKEIACDYSKTIYGDEDLAVAIKNIFKETYYQEIREGEDVYKYIFGSENYIKRVIKKGDLSKFGVKNSDPFLSTALINPYLPKGTLRSDYQFIMYFIVTHALNTYNKGVKNHFDLGNTDKAKESISIAYLLAERFGYEGKELNNIGITINIILNLVDEMDKMLKNHITEVVDEIFILKQSQDHLLKQLNETTCEVERLEQLIMEKELSISKYLLKEKEKLQKDIYSNLKDEFQLQIESQKKQIKLLENQIKEQNEEDVLDEVRVTYEQPVFYASDTNMLFVGDYNFRCELLESIFKSVKKIDGNNSSNLNIESILGSVDLVVYQYTYSQHDSARILKEAVKRGIRVVQVSLVNPAKILDEIYAQIYRK